MEFEEKQHLKLWWLYILLGVETIVVLSIILFDKGGMSFQQLREIYFLPFAAILLPFILIYIIQKNTLTLNIDADGISYKYFPFRISKRLFDWKSITKVYIRKYDALSEYGGWGYRTRLWFKFKDRAYLLNNESRGLQIEFSNGKKLLFSSNKIDELQLFLINLKTKYNIQAIH